ncbi:Nif3-like dinuclear metal center hexameric protein [Desulfuromonas sp. AOP6]|uniref:Nif3-like dinuclear metal center hexameric protein n=1 Tax=Desulfuromonas sp. AOP6 TaxID=1566351 RepID=UPI0012748378|nr:Nif3-like dinuclear metal center hexameric protein [Desulfuromonas sp. AOP6]BCA78609.1 GTP cyclohydrolase 1 type 2 [Desulfuromonas sp. AOP6]
MKKEQIVRIQDLVGLIHALYPSALAEEWDNVGLQVGDPAAAVKTALICLDPSEKALAAARSAGAQAIISHHPLIFRPLKNIQPTDETGRILFQAIRDGIAVFSAHTNLDRGRDGLNDWLARTLQLTQVLPLALGGSLVKLVVFVPSGHEEVVSEALFAAGAGQVGRYDRVSFRSAGQGSFRPGSGAQPFIGTLGETARVDELRLEVVLPRESVNKVVSKMIKAHPYEEVAYDLVPLLNSPADIGLGRIGRLSEPATLASLAERVKQGLGLSSLRLVGHAEHRIVKVAVCGGSGASLLSEAKRQGADVLVTGDVKYHEARQAESLNMALIDASHFGTERIMVPNLARVLKEEAIKKKLEVEFIEMEGEGDPFTTV